MTDETPTHPLARLRDAHHLVGAEIDAVAAAYDEAVAAADEQRDAAHEAYAARNAALRDLAAAQLAKTAAEAARDSALSERDAAVSIADIATAELAKANTAREQLAGELRDANQKLADRDAQIESLAAALDEALTTASTYRAHSIQLNAIAFRLAADLGRVGDDDTVYHGDIDELVETYRASRTEAIDDRDRLADLVATLTPTVDQLVAEIDLINPEALGGILRYGTPRLWHTAPLGGHTSGSGVDIREALTALRAAVTPPDPTPMGPPLEAISVRVDARPDTATLDRVVDIFNTRNRYGLIVGAYDPQWVDPQGERRAGPMASLDWWANPRSNNYILHHLAELAGDNPAVIEFTFPLLLRGAHKPAKDPASARQRRDALLALADGKLRMINGRLYLDDVNRYADAVVAGCEREGVQATNRGPHETDGFEVYPPSPPGWVVLDRDGGAVLTEHGIVTDQGVPVTTEMQCQYHRDSAMDEFAAAFRVFANVWAERGIPMTRSGDKRNCDVLMDGPYAGRVVSDVHFDLIGDLFVPRQHGPSWWGIDLYAEAALSVEGVVARYGNVVEQAARQARALGLKMSFGELGEGSGREDKKDEPLDRGEPWYGLFDLLSRYPSTEFGHVCVYVPNNEHSIDRTLRPNRREAVFNLLGAADKINMPLYAHEVRP